MFYLVWTEKQIADAKARAEKLSNLFVEREATKPTEQPDEIAKILHYPEHWDTAAYPTLETAIIEALGGFVCGDESHCEQPQGEQR